ncbi:MAG TPA: hypothetical protein VFI09_00915 [Solirubrobacterales bacterium]|nr:hypothetical protein [Solirubrobacterales bacterium]
MTARYDSDRRAFTRERLQLLGDLHHHLPRTRGSMRRRTEEAIRQLELELAPGRATERKVVNER